jgi:hypothetical protein
MKRKYIRIIIIMLAAMAIILTVQLVNNRSLEEAMPLNRIIVLTLISGVFFLPLALISILLDGDSRQNQMMKVKEIRLNEQEIREAAALWVFTQHGVAPEGEVELFIDEEENISCLVHIPG